VDLNIVNSWLCWLESEFYLVPRNKIGKQAGEALKERGRLGSRGAKVGLEY